MEIKPHTVLDEVLELEEKRTKLSVKLKERFHHVLKPLFDKSQNITSIGWTQSSPYNDTDYSFEVGEVIINGVSQYDDDFDEENISKEMFNNTIALYETERNLIEEIQKTINSIPSDMMESMFGNGVKLTFHKDGTFEEDEYEDY